MFGNSGRDITHLANDHLLAVADKLAGGLFKSWVGSWLIRLLATSVFLVGEGWLAAEFDLFRFDWGGRFEGVIRLNCFLPFCIIVGDKRRRLLFG